MSPAPTAAASVPGPRVNRKALVLGLAVSLPLLAVLVRNLDRDPHTVRSPLVGQPAPPFALTPVGGGASVTLESLRGKPAVINFWATWCVPCLQEHPALAAAARAMGSDVRFLGIVHEDEEARVRSFLAERGQAYPSLLDDDARTAIAYGVAGVPETYFIDATGRISAKYSLPLDPETIVRLVSRAKAEAR